MNQYQHLFDATLIKGIIGTVGATLGTVLYAAASEPTQMMVTAPHTAQITLWYCSAFAGAGTGSYMFFKIITYMFFKKSAADQDHRKKDNP